MNIEQGQGCESRVEVRGVEDGMVLGKGEYGVGRKAPSKW